MADDKTLSPEQKQKLEARRKELVELDKKRQYISGGGVTKKSRAVMDELDEVSDTLFAHEWAEHTAAQEAAAAADNKRPCRSRHAGVSKEAAEAQATQEWNNDANLRERFSSKESYVSIRARELTGEFRVSGSGSVRTG